MRKIPTLISISECQKVKARRYFVSYSRMLQRNSTINTLLLIPVSLQIPTEKTIMRRVVEKNLVQNDIIKMAQNALEIHFTCTIIECIRRTRHFDGIIVDAACLNVYF